MCSNQNETGFTQMKPHISNAVHDETKRNQPNKNMTNSDPFNGTSVEKRSHILDLGISYKVQ